MQAVRYARAASVAEAVRLLEEGGPTARVLAGGTDVIVQARERRRDIGLFVDVKHVPETMAFGYHETNGLTVGAAVPLYRIYGEAGVRRGYPALVESASVIGGTAIQGRASLGGNLCNSSPAADCIPAMMVMDGVAAIAGPNGERDVAVQDFCTGPGTNVLEAGEFVVSLRFPPPARDSGDAWQRFIPRNEMDIAVVNAASRLRLEGGRVVEARIAIGAVAPTPLAVEAAVEAVTGAPLSDGSIAAAVAAARAAASPISDMRGTADYRRHVVGVLVERTLRLAAERANGGMN